MAVSLREYRARIRSTESMKKITRAMELIAASRIIKAQQRAQAATPYARELTRAVSAVATFSNVDHALTTEPESPDRAAVLIVTSDRGLAKRVGSPLSARICAAPTADRPGIDVTRSTRSSSASGPRISPSPSPRPRSICGARGKAGS